MKKILCATDLSSKTDNAVKYAAKLASELKGELTLFMTDRISEKPKGEPSWGQVLNNDSAIELLRRQCADVTENFNVTCKIDDRIYINNEERVEGAVNDFDLLVMGISDPDGLFQRIKKGAYPLVNTQRIPFLLVPTQARYRDIRSVVFAYDYWKSEHQSVGQLTAFLRPLGAKLIALQILEDSVYPNREKEVNALRTILYDMSQVDEVKFDYLYSADRFHSANDYMIDNSIDLLALSSENRAFNERLFQRTLLRDPEEQSSYPVLVFQSA